MKSDRPIPTPDPTTLPYWRAARAHRLELPQCRRCSKFHSYPRTLCPFCSCAELQWKACSGRGTIYSFTELFRAPGKAFVADLPYIVAIVALEEGPHLMTRLIAPEPGKVRIGQAVQVSFEDLNDEISLPLFKVTE